jgi:hypothetical protein
MTTEGRAATNYGWLMPNNDRRPDLRMLMLDFHDKTLEPENDHPERSGHGAAPRPF